MNRVKSVHSRQGLTLMEILIVLALIAMIAGLVITNLGGIFGGGQESVAQMFVKDTLKTPLTSYRLHMGSYPSTEEGLKALISAPEGKEARWKGPYVEELPEDPWGNPYQYRYPGVKKPGSFDLFSFGPDKVESEDDIVNWNKGSA